MRSCFKLSSSSSSVVTFNSVARAAAVHSLLQSAAQEDDLCVLAAQLDDGVGVGLILHHRFVGGKDLLYKIHPRIFGKS